MLKPLGDRVVIKVKKEEEKNVGGIILTSNAQEQTKTGEVIAVGKGFTTANGEVVALEVKAGDQVLFEAYAGTEVDYEGEKYLVMHEKDIMAVLA